MRNPLAAVLALGVLAAGLPACPGARAAPADPDRAACGRAIEAAERVARTAPGLLAAIGTVESGRATPPPARGVPGRGQ